MQAGGVYNTGCLLMREGGFQPEGEERKDFHASQASWQDAITEYCSKQYDTPTGHAYPNGVAFFLHTLQSQAEQAGERETAGSLKALNDAYGLIALPFLSVEAKAKYVRAFYERGWLQRHDNEEMNAVELSDEQFRSLTRLVDKANIPEMYALTGKGEIPHRTTIEGKQAIPVAPALAHLRQIAGVMGLNWKGEEQTPSPTKKYPTVPRMRLVRPIDRARVIRGGAVSLVVL